MATSTVIDGISNGRPAQGGRARRRAALLAAAVPVCALSGLAAAQIAGHGDRWLLSWPVPLLVALFVLLSARMAGGTLARLALGSGGFDAKSPRRSQAPEEDRATRHACPLKASISPDETSPSPDTAPRHVAPTQTRATMPSHIALPLGLAAFALLAFALGLTGLLDATTLLAVCVAAWVEPLVTLIARTRGRCVIEMSRALFDRIDASLRRLFRRPDVWLPLAPFPLFFVWASLPPTFYDAVVYHLGLPNFYLASGGLVWPERFSIAAYPQYAEMINLYPLALGSETAAALTAFLVAGAAALSLRSSLAGRFGRWPAALGTLFVVAQWPFWFQALFLKNDLLAAFFLLTALRLLLVPAGSPRTDATFRTSAPAQEHHAGRTGVPEPAREHRTDGADGWNSGHEADRGHEADSVVATQTAKSVGGDRGLRRVALAGALAGMAVGTKWLAGLPVLLIVLLVLPRGGWRARGAGGWREVLVFVAMCGALVAPWLVRNAAHHGNPVFPALYEQLGGVGFSAESAERMASATGRDIDRAPLSVLRRVAGIGWTGGYGSGGEVSWLLLPALLAGLLAARSADDRRLLLVAILTLGLGVGLLSAYLRLFWIALLLGGAAVAAVAAWPRGRVARTAMALLVVIAGGQGLVRSVMLCERLTDGGSAVARGERGLGEHLERLVNYAPLAGRIDERVPADARVLVVGSARTAYIPRRAEASYAWDEPRLAAAYREGFDHAALTGRLVESGFTHVLLNSFDLELVERDQSRFGREGVAWLNGWFATLELLDRENDAYLFALPERDEQGVVAAASAH